MIVKNLSEWISKIYLHDMNRDYIHIQSKDELIACTIHFLYKGTKIYFQIKYPRLGEIRIRFVPADKIWYTWQQLHNLLQLRLCVSKWLDLFLLLTENGSYDLSALCGRVVQCRVAMLRVVREPGPQLNWVYTRQILHFSAKFKLLGNIL